MTVFGMKESNYITGGLEWFIQPKGFKMSEDSKDLLIQYDYMIKTQTEYNKYLKDMERDNYKVVLPSEDFYEKLIVEDDSMDAYGIKKSLVVTYKKNSHDFVNGEIYVVKCKGRDIIRRIWKCGDKVILIPCSVKPEYPIEEFDKEKVEICGTIINVIYNLP